MDPHSPAEIAFDAAPVGLALTEDRIVRRCNMRFSEIFAGAAGAFTDRPLEDLYPTPRDYESIGARALDQSYRTIEAHRARLMRKVGARNLPDLVAKFTGMPH